MLVSGEESTNEPSSSFSFTDPPKVASLYHNREGQGGIPPLWRDWVSVLMELLLPPCHNSILASSKGEKSSDKGGFSPQRKFPTSSPVFVRGAENSFPEIDKIISLLIVFCD